MEYTRVYQAVQLVDQNTDYTVVSERYPVGVSPFQFIGEWEALGDLVEALDLLGFEMDHDE